MKPAKQTRARAPHPALKGEVIPFPAVADDDLGDYALDNLLRFDREQLEAIAKDLARSKAYLTAAGHEREAAQVERQERAVAAVLTAKK